MRISYFVPRCTPDNSHGRYIIELASRFGSEHDVTINAGVFWPPLRSRVRCRFLPVPNRPALIRLGALWLTSNIARDRKRSDIVHVNGADAPVGNVVTAQCCNAVMRNAGHKPGFIRKLNYAVGVPAEKYCMTKESTKRVIAISNQVKNEIVKAYEVDPSRISVVYHGVDLDLFNPQHRAQARQSVRMQMGIGPEEFLVVFVGGDYRLKGLVPLLEATQRVGGRIKILGVGIEPDSELRALVAANGYRDLVKFVPNTPRIAELYSAGDCYVLPTLYDTFSMATLEAMACGLPVIVSRKAGITELLSSTRDCFILEDPQDTHSLAGFIERLVRDETLRSRMGSEARRTAEANSWDVVADRTMSAYREILANPK